MSRAAAHVAVRGWVKANGGPLSLVVVGLGLLSLSLIAGLVVAGIGLAWFVLTISPVQRRIPFTVVRKSTLVERRLSDEGRGERCLALSSHAGSSDFTLAELAKLLGVVGHRLTEHDDDDGARA